MKEDILSIKRPVIFAESTAHCVVHMQQSYASSTFNISDEVRITVQHQDACVLPSKSSLHISGILSLANGDPVTRTSLVNNAICHLFEEARYEINDIEIDRIKNVGLTTLMKNYATLNPGQERIMENVGWLKFDDETQLTNADGYFDIVIPLGILLGLADDYHKIIINAKHKLILVRSKTDANAILQTAPNEDYNISIYKVEWL